jgi:hypothetical protein
MKQCRARSAPMLVCLVALLAGCGGDDGGPSPAEDHGFVVDSLIVPSTANEALTTYGLDIDGKDGDADRGVDNALGRSFATLSDTIDVGAAVLAGVDNGTIILLVNARAAGLTANGRMEVGMYLGANPMPAACESEQDETCRKHLDGAASFELAPDAPTDTVLTGSLQDGGFSMGAGDEPGRVALALPALDGGEPIVLELVGARVSIQSVSETGLTSGIIGGAVPAEDFEQTILPSFHAGLVAQVAADCTGTPLNCCTADSPGQGILLFFDPISVDCMVSYDEFRNHPFLSPLFNPDVDLFDADGNYAPNSDGTNDALSLGLGFSAVTATFTAP